MVKMMVMVMWTFEVNGNVDEHLMGGNWPRKVKQGLAIQALAKERQLKWLEFAMHWKNKASVKRVCKTKTKANSMPYKSLRITNL